MNLRLIGLAAVVVCTALLPLAAAASPAGEVRAGEAVRDVRAARPEADAKVRGERGSPVRPSTAIGLLPRLGDGDGAAGAGADGGGDGDGERGADRSAQCGPEVASPGGVEAQTCVLTHAGETWGRTYYRNAMGRELKAVLTLMGPADRTVQTYCAVAADDEPDVCETPREPSRGDARKYSAVTEFAAADQAEEGPLLLRSGSNSAAREGR
ncbi:hypothetical protein [Streptomyces sp. MUM 178J]|uniref:hypothetical protein n=1 Tax=Streptomyces sp. MUM 178J TaxID=2791991 RepID=UPI001F036486|nr:hypothetical protein [Streptomyces sp. MUM 178J]WRQ82575.1 hypothetical protein I3F59_026245 [Streptomyces sp. MUM 178J]